MPLHNGESVASRYKKLTVDRQRFLDEARDSATLTIPSLMPENSDAMDRERNSPVFLDKPWQSIGARGVTNLASRLLLTLFPTTGSFFRYEPSPKVREELETSGDVEAKTDLQQRLAARERHIMRELDAQNIRAKAFGLFKHLIVAGNALVYMPPKGGMRVFPLHHYVVRRDFMGNVVEIIYVEILDRMTVDPKLLPLLEEDLGDDDSKDKPVNLFTYIRREGESLNFHQEVNSKEVPDSAGTTPVDRSPWMALRFVAIDGEDYGRGYVEEFRGDLKSLESLSKSITIASLNAAKVVPLINPNATISPSQLVKAANGEPLVGAEGDVTFLRLDKGADMSVAAQRAEKIEQALAADFLLNSSFQRRGERVTAEEIRRMAEELEDTLGGVFSVMSQELQLPLARRIEAQLESRGDIRRLPKGTVQPLVVTGLAAIGRGQDLQRLRDGLDNLTAAQAVVPGLGAFVKAAEIAKRIWLATGIDDVDALLKTQEDVADEQAQAQRQALVGGALQGAAPAAGKALVESGMTNLQNVDPEQLQQLAAQSQGQT